MTSRPTTGGSVQGPLSGQVLTKEGIRSAQPHKRERGCVTDLHASSFPNNRLKPKEITAPPIPPLTNHPAVLPIP